MSETSRELVHSDQPTIVGPDFFSFYAREVADLLCGDDILSSFPRDSKPESACTVVQNGKGGEQSLFSDIIADSISGVKKELLKTLWRDSLSMLTKEVDEMLNPIVALRHELSKLRCKKQKLTMDLVSNVKLVETPCKKTKEVSFSSHGMSFDDAAIKSDLAMQVDEDEDMEQLEQILVKHAKEYALTLNHMEQKLEEILETTTSQCRTMTRIEKQELKSSIQKLPSKNLERVAEIISRNKLHDSPSSDEVFVDLENEDNTTLWRIYFYIKAVDNARKLAQ